MPRAVVFAFALLAGCSLYDGSPTAAPLDAAAAPVAERCVYRTDGAQQTAGGLCSMAVTVAIACEPGKSGRITMKYGETSPAGDFGAAFDAGYACGVPVTAARDGFACDTPVVQVQARWWTPDGRELPCVDYFDSP